MIQHAETRAHYRELIRRRRDRHQERRTILDDRAGVVLLGAGTVGREFLLALRAAGVHVFSFADNASGKWGTDVDGIVVMPPDECFAQFGKRAAYIVTIGRIGREAVRVVEDFRARGADGAVHFIDAIADVPGVWPNFFLDPDAFSEDDAEQCEAAYSKLADDESRQQFLAHLTWRATLDPGGLAFPTYDDQYFPAGVISAAHCRAFVDIGAFTGDTLSALRQFAGTHPRQYYGFEPDPVSYNVLTEVADTVRRAGISVETHNVALGSRDGWIGFSGEGRATSQLDVRGGTQVRCARLDDFRIPAATYVKIDVEGEEAAVLAGADETLSRLQPTIAIATYHHPADLFELPLRISQYAPDYALYLRSHGDAGIDLVCYAVRDARAS